MPSNEPISYWALRGGGGNFGVVTEFEFALHPFDRNVLSGSIFWPIAQVRDVLEHYAEAAPRYSDDMYIGPWMGGHPELGEFVAVDVVYAGDPADGERELAPLRAIGDPTRGHRRRARLPHHADDQRRAHSNMAFARTRRAAWLASGRKGSSTR